MSRRMIDPQTIIKSQVVDDKKIVDLNEILEKYGWVNEVGAKMMTIQIYNKEVDDDNTNFVIVDDETTLCSVVINGSFTISKQSDDRTVIRGMLVDNLNDMNFINYFEIPAGGYEDGILLVDQYDFDLHVIKV